MKQYLRILPLPVIIVTVLTVLDLSTGGPISWLPNLLHGLMIGVIGCLGQFLIHRNILQDDNDDSSEDSGCIGCGKPE